MGNYGRKHPELLKTAAPALTEKIGENSPQATQVGYDPSTDRHNPVISLP